MRFTSTVRVRMSPGRSHVKTLDGPVEQSIVQRVGAAFQNHYSFCFSIALIETSLPQPM